RVGPVVWRCEPGRRLVRSLVWPGRLERSAATESPVRIARPGQENKMATATERQILDALRRVADPDKGADIVSLRMVAGVVIRDRNVAFAMEVEPERGPRLEPLRKAAEKAVEALPGVLSVTAVLTAQAVAPGRNAPHPAAGGRTQRGAVAGVN